MKGFLRAGHTRPVGGWLSDRVGGYRVLVLLLAGFGVCVALVGTLPTVRVAVALLFIGWRCSAWGTERSSSSCRSVSPNASAW